MSCRTQADPAPRDELEVVFSGPCPVRTEHRRHRPTVGQAITPRSGNRERPLVGDRGWVPSLLRPSGNARADGGRPTRSGGLPAEKKSVSAGFTWLRMRLG